MRDLFESTIRRHESALQRNKRIYNLTGYAKLALFILFAVCTYYSVSGGGDFTFSAAVVTLLIVQIAAWIYHFKINGRLERSKGIIEINRRHLYRISGKWVEFPDTGEEFSDAEHPYGSDLDITGKSSLFQFLNTAHTWYGRRGFAADLLHAEYTKGEIVGRQAAVRELGGNTELADELEYRFSRIGSDPAAETMAQELSTFEPFIENRLLKTVLMYSPVFTILLIVLTLTFHWEQLYFAAVIFISIQALVWMIGLSASFRYVRSVSRLPFKLNAYNKVLKLVETEKFKAEELLKIQSELTGGGASAVKAIKDLAGISNRVSVRGTPIVYFLFNILLLWDFRCAFSLEDWRRKYAPYCEGWFRALGEMESLLSFSTMLKVCSHTSFPEISDVRGMEASELGHPLINGEFRVTNRMSLDNNIIIISGSNMSGKTTYLRTAGINLVLARAGGAVCAKEMTCSDLHLVTSMRIADDLNEGISTFYAELKRIKRILDAAGQDRSTVFLIDEIFRGTNSVDRLSGARTVISKLNELKAIGMVTTHDLDLCELEKDHPRIRNYNFSEDYQDGRIRFDYKIKEGISRTTNAKYLMEMVGIL